MALGIYSSFLTLVSAWGGETAAPRPERTHSALEVLTAIFRGVHAGADGPASPDRLIQRGLSRQSSCSLMDEALATL